METEKWPKAADSPLPKRWKSNETDMKRKRGKSGGTEASYKTTTKDLKQRPAHRNRSSRRTRRKQQEREEQATWAGRVLFT